MKITVRELFKLYYMSHLEAIVIVMYNSKTNEKFEALHNFGNKSFTKKEWEATVESFYVISAVKTTIQDKYILIITSEVQDA